MRVMVTGHLGYIGAVLVPVLQAAGHEVIGLDSGLYAGTEAEPLSSIPNVVGDVRDVERRHLEAVDAVIHLAGLSNDPLGDLDPKLTYDINHHGSIRLAETARAAGVHRFLFASSCSVYGVETDSMADEESTLRPLTPYAESKISAELEIGRLASPDFCPAYLRCATAFGVSPMQRFDIVLPNLVGHAVRTGRVLLRSDGTPWRPLVHIRDITLAYLLMLEAPKETISNRPFNIGSSTENRMIGEIARHVAEAVPGATVAFAEGASPDKRSYRVSFDKVTKALPRFQAGWTTPAGAKEMYAAMARGYFGEDDFEGPRFTRIRHINERIKAGSLDRNLRPERTQFAG